jgi:hypothetical protein
MVQQSKDHHLMLCTTLPLVSFPAGWLDGGTLLISDQKMEVVGSSEMLVPSSVHGVTTQKTTMDIFAVIRTSNFTSYTSCSTVGGSL